MSRLITCPTCACESEDAVASPEEFRICKQCQCRWNEEQRTEEIPWRCFHCGEICWTDEEALEHFGATQISKPACQLAPDVGGLVAIVREQEAELRNFRAEDTATSREFYALGARHAAALREMEEKGYAKGLADAAELRGNNGEIR